MADDRRNDTTEEMPRHEGTAGEAPAPDADLDAQVVREDASDWTNWSNLWQVPALVISLALIGLAIVVARGKAPENDFAGAFDEIDRLIVTGSFDVARERLATVIEPNLLTAGPADQARYHATVADWLAASQESSGVNVPANDRTIDEQYREAVAGGVVLTPLRIERWAMAQLQIGRMEEARQRLDELEALSVTDAVGREARLRRNRVLRALVERGITREGLSADDMMGLLAEYRDDPLLEVTDRAWAMTRQARLRLDQRQAGAAVDHLLIDMRRLEHEKADLDDAVWGEMYTLLGHGFHEQGLHDTAAFHLRNALARLSPGADARAEALFLLGRIDVANQEHESGLERFDEVVRDFPGAAVRLPALLARADALAITGDHPSALDDYRTLVTALRAGEGDSAAPRHLVKPAVVAEHLIDRHEAALTVGDLPLALSYVEIAESLFDAPEVPVDVLVHIASVSRQIAHDIMAQAREIAARAHGLPDPALVPVRDLDPELRYQAVQKYERAGDYFVRHARALTAAPGRDEDWARSLRLAGDSFDLAGRLHDAVEHFREYVVGRPESDPQRLLVGYRLARALHALMEYEAAAAQYQWVIEESPNANEATKSYVPLAECLVALGRTGDAENLLTRVVDGRTDGVAITPEADDHRDALFALGRIYHDTDRHTEAIERLAAGVSRHPDAPMVNEMRYLLADSEHRHAKALRDMVMTDTSLPPSERRRLETLAKVELERALLRFGEVADEYAARDQARLARLQLDYQRFAHFSRGDCAYELGRYQEAAALYDLAARRYSDHHASMQALVKIVNCYDRLGDKESADIAHRNALIRLQQLPDDAFADPQALMDRGAWEHWLRSRPLGSVPLSAAAATP